MLLRRPGRAGRAEEIVAVIDIGTSKVCAAIALLAPGGARAAAGPAVRVLGFGFRRSEGVRAGHIVDLAAATQCVRAAVAQAEQQADVRIDHAYLGLPGAARGSRRIRGCVDLQGAVTAADLARLETGAREFASRGGDCVLGLEHLSFSLDGIAGVAAPIGMAGRRLWSESLAIAADQTAAANVLQLAGRSHLSAVGLLPVAYAGALAVTDREERHLGVTAIDIGAGTTSIAAFARGRCVFCETVPLGGDDITLDLARMLSTPLAEAERIKALYGTLTVAASDEHELVAFPRAGEKDWARAHTSKAAVGTAVRRKVEGLLRFIRTRMEQSGVAGEVGPRVVLTGGSSQLLAIAGFASSVLGKDARLGRPAPIAGLPGAYSGPAFAAVAGMLACVQSPPDWLGRAGVRSSGRSSYLGRIEQWLRESF